MRTLFAMRRANGDWFALDDNGRFRVPVFRNNGDAMIARSREAGMECFRPVALDPSALQNLTSTQESSACFWLVGDPARKLTRGVRLNQTELLNVIYDVDGDGVRADG
jgi:hypothetical protein